MSAQQMLSALKAAEPVLEDVERIINKRLPVGSSVVRLPELQQVRAAIRAQERMCVDQGCIYFGHEAPKGCSCHG